MSAQPLPSPRPRLEVVPDDGPETHDFKYRNPEEFVHDHSGDLRDSAAYWDTLKEDLFEEMAKDHVVSGVRYGLGETARDPDVIKYAQDYVKSVGGSKCTVRVDANTAKASQFAQDYTKYSVVALRHVADRPNSSQYLTGSVRETMFGKLPYMPAKVVMKACTVLDLTPYFQGIVHNMRVSDKASGRILLDLCQQIADQPDFLELLEKHFAKGEAGNLSPESQELRSMMSADWHNPNTQGTVSVLRTFCGEIANNPRYLEGAFLDAVARAEVDQRQLRTIRDMASYALMAAQMEVNDIAIATHLHRNISDPRFEILGIPQAYAEFTVKHIEKIKRVISAIASPLEYGDIRAHRSDSDLNHAVGKFDEYFVVRSRADRRRSGRPTGYSKDEISPPRKRPPSQKDTEPKGGKEPVGATPEQETIPDKKLMFTTRDISRGGLSLTEMTAEEIVRKKATTGDQLQLEKDLVKMVQRLQKPQRMANSGAKRLRTGNRKYEKYKGKKYGVRSFSSELYNRHQADNPELQLEVSKEAENWRIDYIVVDDMVCIVDILDHQDYDKKHASSN